MAHEFNASSHDKDLGEDRTSLVDAIEHLKQSKETAYSALREIPSARCQDSKLTDMFISLVVGKSSCPRSSLAKSTIRNLDRGGERASSTATSPSRLLSHVEIECTCWEISQTRRQ